MEEPITGMTRERRPSALCNDFSEVNILLNYALLIILWLAERPIITRTWLALSLFAYIFLSE